MELTRLRTRFLLSGGIAFALVLALVAVAIAERLAYDSAVAQVEQAYDAALLARELSLYTQYGAHDINAYALGHLEHREKFISHDLAFDTALTRLLTLRDQGALDDGVAAQVAGLRQLRTGYRTAALNLFIAADTNRVVPTPESRAAFDAAWARANQLVDEIDVASDKLSTSVIADARGHQADLAQRARMAQWVLGVAGAVAAALVLVAQVLAARAVGRPIGRLLEAVRGFTAGAYGQRVSVTSRDEVGELGEAFNTLAETIQRQTADLAVQYEAAHARQAEAEAARAALAEQLATVEEQRAVIRDMSTPVLPIGSGTLVMPLVGVLDAERLQLVQSQALDAVQRTPTRHLILDITGVPLVDMAVAEGLLAVVRAVRLLGSKVILVGVRPEVAQSLVALGVDWSDIVTRASLAGGLSYALGPRVAA